MENCPQKKADKQFKSGVATFMCVCSVRVRVHVQWIAECQGCIEDPSLTDWRKETLEEGVKLYEEFIQRSKQKVADVSKVILEFGKFRGDSF